MGAKPEPEPELYCNDSWFLFWFWFVRGLFLHLPLPKPWLRPEKTPACINTKPARWAAVCDSARLAQLALYTCRVISFHRCSSNRNYASCGETLEHRFNASLKAAIYWDTSGPVYFTACNFFLAMCSKSAGQNIISNVSRSSGHSSASPNSSKE